MGDIGDPSWPNTDAERAVLLSGKHAKLEKCIEKMAFDIKQLREEVDGIRGRRWGGGPR